MNAIEQLKFKLIQLQMSLSSMLTTFSRFDNLIFIFPLVSKLHLPPFSYILFFFLFCCFSIWCLIPSFFFKNFNLSICLNPTFFFSLLHLLCSPSVSEIYMCVCVIIQVLSKITDKECSERIYAKPLNIDMVQTFLIKHI